MGSLHGKKVPGHPNLQYWGPNDFIRVRIAVPAGLVKQVGKTELVRGLKTQCVAEAVRRSHSVIAEFQEQIRAAREQIKAAREPRQWEPLALPPRRVQSITIDRGDLETSITYLPDDDVPIPAWVDAMHNPESVVLPVEQPASKPMPLAGYTYEAGLLAWVASKGDQPPAPESIPVYRAHLKRLFARLGHDEMGRNSEANI